MGSLHVMESKSMIDEGTLTLDNALCWHLTGNHYPPVSLDFLPAVKEALSYAQDAIDTDDDELWKKVIELPNGKKLTVAAIIEGLHLDGFLNEVI